MKFDPTRLTPDDVEAIKSLTMRCTKEYAAITCEIEQVRSELTALHAELDQSRAGFDTLLELIGQGMLHEDSDGEEWKGA